MSTETFIQIKIDGKLNDISYENTSSAILNTFKENNIFKKDNARSIEVIDENDGIVECIISIDGSTFDLTQTNSEDILLDYIEYLRNRISKYLHELNIFIDLRDDLDNGMRLVDYDVRGL